MSPRQSAILVVVVFVLPGGAALANGKGRTPDRVTLLVERLGDPYESVRRRTRRMLRLLSERAVPAIRQALSHPEFVVRRNAARLLGEIAGKRGAPTLLAALRSERAETVRFAIVRVLVPLGEPVMKEVDRIVALWPPRRIDGVRKAIAFWLRREISIRLQEIITSTGGSGHYDGMYARVVALGKRVGPILVEIFSRARNFEDAPRDDTIRQLAIECVGELGDRSLLPVLRRLNRTLTQLSDRHRNSLAAAMARLGDNRNLRLKIAADEARARRGIRDADLYFRLGYNYFRMRDFPRSIHYFERCIQVEPNGHTANTAHYNLACIYSLTRRVERGLDAFRKARQGGYGDMEWIARDRDLDNIRNDPRFKALLANANAPIRIDPARDPR